MKNKERNSIVDIMRGIAMLMVVLGHTMTGCTDNSQKSFLFNVIWSLQMPLFILISGYVTRYSRTVTTRKEFGKYIKKYTISYLLPWAVWTILIRGVIFGETDYLNIRWLLWNMDSGYWFLFTIWTIRLVFVISDYLCQKVVKEVENDRKRKTLVVTGMFYVVSMAVLTGIGLVAGFSFLGIKLTLYYMPFFFAGYIFGSLQEDIYAMKYGKRGIDYVIVVALILWLSAITRVNMYDLADTGLGIILRAGVSLCGCVAVCGLCSGLFNKEQRKTERVLRWCGIHSLEIYTIHYLFLSMIQEKPQPEFLSPEGICYTVLNYGVTILLVVLVARMLNTNRYIRKLAFGKIK